ncbi:MAG: hypothetical protein RSE07_04930 [Oscillospiraceae bacterium]
MIIFNREKFVKDIMKNGIKDSDSIAIAKYKLKCVAYYLKNNTKYRPSVAKNKMKEISVGYFSGLPEDYIDAIITDIYDNIVTDNVNTDVLLDEDNNLIEADDGMSQNETVTAEIYKSEMDKILSLPKRDLQKLAFVFIVYSKYCGRHWIYESNADMYRIAEIKSSGRVRNKMIYELSHRNMIKFQTFINYGYKHKKVGNITNTVFTIPYQVEHTEIKSQDDIVMEIKDFDNMLLYFKKYIGEEGICSCNKCGCPIIKTSNSKKFCDDCAVKIKYQNNKKYKSKTA